MMHTEGYEVKIFPVAQADLRDILENLSASALSSENVAQFHELLMETAEFLKSTPEICPLAKDIQLRLRGYRTLLLKDHIVCYSMSGKTVEIRRILFARPQYEGIF